MSVFLDAIKVLEERGWRQGSISDPDLDWDDYATSPLCLFGALAVAKTGIANVYMANPSDLFYGNEDSVLRSLTDGAPVLFNDDPSTSYEDVILLLKRAHEAWENDRNEVEVG